VSATGRLTLITEPRDGIAPVLSAVEGTGTAATLISQYGH
jgi:hypothetical protein